MPKVAVVQASSTPFDSAGAVQKATSLLREAAAEGAQLVLFPEAFVGGYPKGSTFGNVVGTRNVEGRKLFERYAKGAISLDGDALAPLIEASTETDAHVVIGVIERSGGTLYCTAVTIAPGVGIAGVHRKLMPTAQERLIWGFGDGSTIAPVDTPLGRVGTVICWENYMPLLRQAMYAQGTQIYCAPTADDRDTWQTTMVHIALEGRVYVLSACQSITLDEYPEFFTEQFELEGVTQVMRGGSSIIAPTGEVLAGPVYDQETILYADIDTTQSVRQNIDFDAVGHYARPDVFQLTVNTRPQVSVTLKD